MAHRGDHRDRPLTGIVRYPFIRTGRLVNFSHGLAGFNRQLVLKVVTDDTLAGRPTGKTSHLERPKASSDSLLITLRVGRSR